MDVIAFRLIIIAGSKYSIESSLIQFMIHFVIYGTTASISLKFIGSFIGAKQKLPFKKTFDVLYFLTCISLVLTGAISAVIIFEMIYYSKFSTFLLSSLIIFGTVPSIAILSILVLKFVIWLKAKRDFMISLYTAAVISIIFNYLVILAIVPLSIVSLGEDRKIQSIYSIATSLGRPTGFLVDLFAYSSYISFTLTWFATAILLKNYTKKIGKLLYWLIVAMPMLYFTTQNPQIFSFVFSEIRFSEPRLYFGLFIIVFGITRSAGGLFFAMGFWLTARYIKKYEVKTSLRLFGFGILLVFISTQIDISVPRVGIVYAPFPPFGAIALSAPALGTFLIFIGLYLAASSVAKDAQLRKEIAKRAGQALLLGKLGTAEMEENVLREVKPVMNKLSKISEESTTSFDEQDVKLLVRQALEEIKRQSK
jgi:hypothetical protein